MSYKWLYKIVIILALLVHFLCLLLLDVARINKDWSKVAIYAAILILIFVWTTCFSCGIMPWHEKNKEINHTLEHRGQFSVLT